MIINPEFIQNSIVNIIGIMFISIGLINLIIYFYNRRQDSYTFSLYIISIIIGIIVMFCSGFILSAIRTMIAIWIIFTGIVNLHRTIIWKSSISRFWIVSLILAITTIIAGVYILLDAGSILRTIGIILTIYGIINIVENMLFMKKINNFMD